MLCDCGVNWTGLGFPIRFHLRTPGNSIFIVRASEFIQMSSMDFEHQVRGRESWEEE